MCEVEKVDLMDEFTHPKTGLTWWKTISSASFIFLPSRFEDLHLIALVFHVIFNVLPQSTEENTNEKPKAALRVPSAPTCTPTSCRAPSSFGRQDIQDVPGDLARHVPNFDQRGGECQAREGLGPSLARFGMCPQPTWVSK